MKHVQKLPKNAGDSVLLGTVLAIGIQPELNQVFVSFDCNGELVTYSMDNADIANNLYQKLRDRIIDSDLFSSHYKFVGLTQRDDLRCEVQDNKKIRIMPANNPGDYVDFSIDPTKTAEAPWWNVYHDFFLKSNSGLKSQWRHQILWPKNSEKNLKL